MKQWNEYGVDREADENTFNELMQLRSTMANFTRRARENEKEGYLVILGKISETLDRIEKKMGNN